MIYRILLLRALEGRADKKDIEQLKHAINHVSVPSDLTNLLNNQNGNVLYQPAMLQGINPQQKVDVVDLTSNFGVDKNLSKKDLSKYIQSLVGVSVSSADKKAILNFVTRSKRVGKNDVLIPDHIAGSSKVETVYKDERKSLVNNIVDLIEKSVLIEVAPNNDRKLKPDVDNYLRFYVPVQIGSDIYTVRIVAENNQKKDLFNIKSGNVYDVIIDKKMPTSSTSPVIQGNLMKSASDNSISDTDNTFNPQQITIEEMLKNVIGADNNVYFQPGYHGSAAKFDKFDDDFIGSGEGAQVHGYGHYVAKDKNIADERYRKILAQPFKNAKYDGMPLHKTNFPKLHHAVLEELFLKGKNEALDKLEDLKEQSNKNKDKDGFLGKSSRRFLEEYNEQLELLNSVDESKITGVNKGQLYLVEIPDDDVLLDEDNTIQEQSQKVISSLKELCRQEGFNYMKVVSGFDKEMKPQTGKQIYGNLRNYIQWQAENNDKAISDEISAKEASQLLNKYGIKGIKYNGNVDGECFVVFDPKNIEITKTFYQSGVNYKDDINQRKDKSKYLTDNEVEQLEKDKQNFETYISKLINGELSPLTQIRVLEHLPSAYNNIPELKGKKVVVTQDVYRKIIDLPNKFNKNHNIDRKRALKLPEFISNPLYILQSVSKGNEHRFVVVANSKGNKPSEKLSIILNPNNNVAVVSAYDENIDISKEKKEGRVLYDKKKELSKTLSASKAVTIDNSNNSISDNSSKNNPKRIGYVFEQPDELQPNLFVNNASERLDGLDTNNEENLYVEPRGPKGYRGRAVLDKNLILVTATGDVTTVVHEYAHWFLDMLENFEGTSDKLDDKLFEVRKYLKNDGSPFTREQHEKFAKSFENYIYRSTAKNSKLREIYEDIKNLLHEIYENILKGEYFIGGDNPLSEQDMANANAVFDELFKLEHKNLQERVFKKIDDCNSIIADIKNNEKKEIARIYAIRDDIKQSLQQQGEIAKSVQQFKDAAEKYADKKENDKWKLYNLDRQNTAYSILSNALGIPSSEIKRKLHSKFPKTREKIELQLREVGDKLSAGDYFYDEKVIEYFGSIDMTDTDSSQQLVNMALDAIDTTVNLDSPLNQDINTFLNKFEYLKKQYAKTPQKNRKQLSVILDVISDLYAELSASSLPSVFISDFASEMQEITKDYADKLDNHSAKTSDAAFYGLVLHKLKDVKLYNAKEKHAVKINHLHEFYSKLPLAKTASGTEKLIREINNALINDVEMRKKSIIAKEISRQLRVNTRTVKTGSRVKKGLYDWKTNSTWLDMAKFNKMNMSELSAELENVITPEIKALYNLDDGLKEMTSAKENSSTVDFSFESKMKKKFIEYKLSGKLENANSALMLDLLSDIIEFKNKARKAKSEKELHDLLQRYDFRNNLAEKILNVSDKHKKLIKYLFHNNSLLNWNTILRVCFGEDAVQKYSIDNEESDKIIYENKILTNFYNKALKCYGIEKTKGIKKYLFDPNGIAKFQKLFRDYEKETYLTEETIYDFKTKEAKTEKIKINRAQIITMFTWYQNDLLRKRLINQFGGEYVGEQELEKLFNYLSDEDKQFAFLLMQTCDEMYDDVNEVMIRSQGLSLEKNENYFPSVVRRHGDSIDNVSLINCRIGQPSATKKRVKSQFVAMKPTNPLSILSRHIDTMSSYVCVSEKASFVSEIFGSPDLQRAFENAFDEQYSEMKKLIGLDVKARSMSVTPINISNSQIPDFKTVSELKKWICENVDLIGNVKIKSNGRNVQFSKTNIGRSLKGTQRSEPQKVSYQILKQLVENSIYGRKKDVDERHKYRNNGQELYYNAFTYKGKTFGVEIRVDIPKRKETPNTYAGHKVKIIETIPAATKVGSKELTFNSPSIASISISDIFRLFNPTGKIKLKKNKTTDGKQIWDYLSGQLAASTFFKYSQSVRTMTEKSKKWINNWIVSSIALSPKIAFGQLLSCINYADGKDISFLDWAKGFTYCMAHPKDTIEFMKQDEFLQARSSQ